VSLPDGEAPHSQINRSGAAVNDPLGYENKTVVVTGVASGMGRAAAQILIDVGANVIGLDVNDISIPVAQAMKIDLKDRQSIESVADSIPGPVDAVFSCAGLPGAPFSELDTAVVNFVGARHLIQRLVPKMPAGAGIATISSSGAIGWQQNLPALLEFINTDGFDGGVKWLEANPDKWQFGGYLISKQAMDAWVSSYASDLIGRGIRLNCINPGPTDTAMMPQFHASATKELVDQALGPIGRYSRAEEQGWPIVLLNSPRMSYVTGEVLWTDGGFQGALVTGRLQAAWAQG
jgi:NAD(P)-dependent dehydrogenase (short-subunit alcohol dehydrogenase family)